MYVNKLYEEVFVIQLPKEGWLHSVFLEKLEKISKPSKVYLKNGAFKNLQWAWGDENNNHLDIFSLF